MMLHVKSYDNRLLCHRVVKKIKSVTFFETQCRDTRRMKTNGATS